MRKYLVLLLVIALAFLAACGPAGGGEDTAAENTEANAAESDEAENTAVTDEELTTTESGLQYVILEEGTGEQAQPGSVVRVHYTGTLEDGTVFDSSRERGEPFTFTLGTGSVIPGWDEGIALLKEGGQARLVIPPELAYGESGAGSTIPPNATLTFDVELVEILPGSPAEPEAVDEADYTTTESGLKYYDLVAGTGETPEEGQPARIHYTVWLEDGTKLDSSLDRNDPLTFSVGEGQLLPGWDEGVSTMQVGGKRQLVVPPDLAFGEESPGPNIPENATLVIEVELLELLAAGPSEPPEVAESDFVESESGLKYYDVVEGTGETPEEGQTLLINYTGWLEDGSKFDSSYLRGQPLPFVLGSGQAIPGWEEGLQGMQVGGQRLLVIPPELGYGAEGFQGVIPPNATLTFLVELVGIQQ